MPAKKANTTPENIDVKETTAEMAVEKTRTTESAEDLIFNPEKKITIKSIANLTIPNIFFSLLNNLINIMATASCIKIPLYKYTLA